MKICVGIDVAKDKLYYYTMDDDLSCIGKTTAATALNHLIHREKHWSR
jgi:hypothetical protein